jgi:hypothetical protein
MILIISVPLERCISDGEFLLRDFPCHKTFWRVRLVSLVQPVFVLDGVQIGM